MFWFILAVINVVPAILLVRIPWQLSTKDGRITVKDSELVLIIGVIVFLIVEVCFFVYAHSFVRAWAQF